MEQWQALPLEEHIKYENLAKEMGNKRKRGTGRIGEAPVTGIESFVRPSGTWIYRKDNELGVV